MPLPFGPDSLPPGYTNPDYNVAGQDLARKRAITNAILARSLQPPQPQPANGGLTVPISPLQSLSGLVQQYFAAKAGEDVGQQEQALGQQYNQGRTQAMRNYISQGATPEAALGLITSQYPDLQKLGMEYQTQMFKGQVTPSDRYKAIASDRDLTGESKVAAQLALLRGVPPEGGGLPESALKQKPMTSVTDNYITRVNPDGTFSRIYGGPTFQDTMIPGAPGEAPMAGEISLPSGHKSVLDRANKLNITNTPENKAATAVATGQVGLLNEAAKESRKAAIDAQGDLRILAPAIDAYKRGIFTGMGQGIQTQAGKFLEAINMKSPDPKVSDTDFFSKTMASRLLKHTSELRPLSDPDRRFLESVLGGKNLTDSTLRRILELGVQNNMQVIQDHNALVQKYSGAEGAVPGFSDVYSVPLPQIPQMPPVGPQAPQPSGTLVPFNGQIQQ